MVVYVPDERTRASSFTDLQQKAIQEKYHAIFKRPMLHYPKNVALRQTMFSEARPFLRSRGKSAPCLPRNPFFLPFALSRITMYEYRASVRVNVTLN